MGAVRRDVENPVTDRGLYTAPISHVFSGYFPFSDAVSWPWVLLPRSSDGDRHRVCCHSRGGCVPLGCLRPPPALAGLASTPTPHRRLARTPPPPRPAGPGALWTR